MKDFRLYDITDFVMDEDFIRWVHKRSLQDEVWWDNWLSQNPAKHLIVAEARRIVESIKMEQPAVPAAEVQEEIGKLMQTIGVEEGKGANLSRSRRILGHFRWTRVAAAVILLAMTGGGALLMFSKKSKNWEKFAYTDVVPGTYLSEKVNNTEKVMAVALPDGSTIELGPGSRVSYAVNFNDVATRDVFLSGEAYFSVVRNSAHPFRVIASEIITRVLGTSFTISSFDKDSTIRVTVRTGKVSVYSRTIGHGGSRGGDSPAGNGDNQSGSIIVTPNQQLLYQRVEQKFEKELVSHPGFIVPDSVDHSMIYEDVPVERVFDQMAKYYGVNIVFDSELLKHCTVTADLADEPFYRKLDLICAAIGAQYEIVDGQVVIQSNGCK